MASGTAILRLLAAFLCPALIYTNFITFRSVGCRRPPGALGFARAGGGPHPPMPHIQAPLGRPPPTALPGAPWAFAGWVLGAKQEPLVPFPRVLRVPCAPSEEALLRTAPEGLQEPGGLDSEKSLLCSPGSR